MATKARITTAATMAPEHLPEDARPEEFLRDEELVGYYERALEAEKDTDRRDELTVRLRQAKRAARETAAAIAEAEEAARASLEEE